MNFLKKKKENPLTEEEILNDIYNITEKGKNDKSWINKYTIDEIKKILSEQKESEITNEIFEYLEEEEKGINTEYYTYEGDVDWHFFWKDTKGKEHDGWISAYNQGFGRS